MIIVLMGYMGSGKTSVGKHLSKILGYDFLDLDEYIESKEKNSVSYIFKTKGEIYFRKKESEYLNKVLAKQNNVVFSLGGGTPCYGNNLEAIINSENVKSFYLKVSIPELVKRLTPEQNKRPLISHINSKEVLMEFFGKHLFERTSFYSAADFTVDTDKKKIEEITEEIILHLV